MVFTTCPSEMAHATPMTVWRLLADAREYGSWIDAHLVSIDPPGPAVPGQRLLLRAPTWGRWFKVSISVERVDQNQRVIELTTRLPFGLRLANRISVAAASEGLSRVQFG